MQQLKIGSKRADLIISLRARKKYQLKRTVV